MIRPGRRCHRPLPATAKRSTRYCPECGPQWAHTETAADIREYVRLAEAFLRYPRTARALYETLREGRR